ncbi:hypothetical protein HB904_04145 [Listeria booriae]|uniref:Uncharacterized protein n=1 Tax=Listeria booriae TaxID=1552123 RepID=A0A842AER8_9LIST|nr:hypothetical protein [Listeria booriae]MBC1615364.1 hypothetical protein [Listeria booriae]
MKKKITPLKASLYGISALILMLVIVVVASIYNNNAAEKKLSSDASEDIIQVPERDSNVDEGEVSTENQSIQPMTYKIGEDLPAGEYYLEANSEGGYFQISSDSTGSNDSIIANGNFTTNAIVTVTDGQYFKFSGSEAMPFSEYTPSHNDSVEDGMYKVGIDFPPGEYKLESTSDTGYLEVSSDSKHSMNSIISNDNFEGQTYITLKDGQYLKLSNAKLFLK